jgi:3-hydroxyisobutyrate dehydrogenase
MRVGFIGVGAIGWPMAGTLIKAGHDVLTFDTDRERLDRFAAEFTCPVASGLAAVAERDCVITVLPTGEIVHQVLLHQEDAAFRTAVRPGTLVIDMGSSDPRGTQALGAELSKLGVALVDAPVSKRVAVFTSSGTPVARASAIPMVIMIRGDAGAVARARPLLADIGDTLFETGPLGSAHALKALNNYASAASHVALAEALLAGQRFGVDPKVMIDVINVSTGRSFVSEVLYKKQIDDPSFRAGFSIGLFAKDIKQAADLATAVGLNAPIARSRPSAGHWRATSLAPVPTSRRLLRRGTRICDARRWLTKRRD